MHGIPHARDRPGKGTRPPGFSLVELLLAVALGSLLLVSLASSAQVFVSS